MKRTVNDSEMLDEYDFSKGIRGKYAQRYATGSNVVVVSQDKVSCRGGGLWKILKKRTFSRSVLTE